MSKLPLAVMVAVLACASPRRPATSIAPTAAPPAATAAALATGVAMGMDAAEVRRRLGAPKRVEQVPSAAVHGTRYERWSYGAREVVLVDGKVIDVFP